MKIPTQKGEHSCKCTEFSLKQKELKIESDRNNYFAPTPRNTSCIIMKLKVVFMAQLDWFWFCHYFS